MLVLLVENDLAWGDMLAETLLEHEYQAARYDDAGQVLNRTDKCGRPDALVTDVDPGNGAVDDSSGRAA